MEKPAITDLGKTVRRSTALADGLDEYAGEWTTTEVVHLLKRTLFGVKVDDLNYFLGLTMAQAVDQLLTPTTAPTTVPLNSYSSNGYTDPTGVAAWDTWINTGIDYVDTELNGLRADSLKCWMTGNMLNERRSIHEKLTLFWENHFAINSASLTNIPSRLWYDYYLILRSNALGNMKQMVKEMTLSPAMLCALNGNTNKKTSPNENYGRELQELYTIGKGLGSHYTEGDVGGATRVLTGHSVDPYFTYYFDVAGHDDQNKNFSNFYGSTIITGRSGAAGASELDDLLNMLFSSPEAAKFICRKLYSFFVYYKIDDSIEYNIITPLANVFRNSGYDITAAMSVLLKSDHFYNMAYSSACLIKSPIDFVLGLVHEFQVKMPDPADNGSSYAAWEIMLGICRELQQELLCQPEVAGWYPYYQGAAYHELWINSVTYTQRNAFTDQMISSGRGGMNMVILVIDPIAFAQSLPNPGDPNKLISDSLDILYRVPLSTDTITAIKQTILLGGLTTDYYWTDAWNAYTTNPTDDVAKGVVFSRLQTFYKYLMNLPEYHLS
jgi:uncharacterized protein (DUF1800 family)